MFESCRPDLRKPHGNKGLSAFPGLSSRLREKTSGLCRTHTAGRDSTSRRPRTVEVGSPGDLP